MDGEYCETMSPHHQSEECSKSEGRQNPENLERNATIVHSLLAVGGQQQNASVGVKKYMSTELTRSAAKQRLKSWRGEQCLMRFEDKARTCIAVDHHNDGASKNV